MTEQEPKSECCEAKALWHQWDDVDEYGQGIYYECWECSKCHKPCKVKEEK